MCFHDLKIKKKNKPENHLITLKLINFITGVLGLYSLIFVSFCLSLMFPTIYGIALGNLNEEQSKIGSAGLVMAIVGSALLPKLQGAIIDIDGRGVNDTLIIGVSEVNFSFLLPFLCFSYIAMYGSKLGQ